VTRVLVAAASAVVRAGLEAVVGSSPTLEVVGTVAATSALPEYVEALQPDVVLVELDRGVDGREPGLPAVSPAAGAPALVILTDDPESLGLADALRLGARAVLPRESQAEEIIAAVEAVAAGLLVFRPDMAESLLPLLSTNRAAAPAQGEALTPREVEVLGMLAEGAGNKLIARRLGISEHTVKFHVGSILAKLRASSRTEAVTIGVRQGLILL
jgi:two-component system, NarL family, response regulator YdfI